MSRIEAAHLYGKAREKAQIASNETKSPDLKSAATDFQKKQQIALLGSQITQSGIDKAKVSAIKAFS